MVPSRIVAPGAEMLRHQPLQGGAVDGRGRIQRTAGAVGAEDPGIEQIEFGMYRKFPLRPFGKDRQPECQEQVFQYFQIPFHGLAVDLTFPGHSGQVEH